MNAIATFEPDGSPDTKERLTPRRRAPVCVYFIRAVTLGHVKIGLACNPFLRLANLQTGSPDKLALLGVIYSDNAARLEAQLHDRFSRNRIHGEWFTYNNGLAGYIKEHAVKVAEPTRQRETVRAVKISALERAKLMVAESKGIPVDLLFPKKRRETHGAKVGRFLGA